MRFAGIPQGMPPDESHHYYLILGFELGLFISASYGMFLAAFTRELLWLWMIPIGTAFGALRGGYRDNHLCWNEVYAYLASHRGDAAESSQR